MAVAKSYENLEQVGSPFEENGKMYVIVKGKCSRCGGSGHYSYNPMYGTVCFSCRGSGIQEQTVRWYTDSQRASMDKAAEKRAAAKAVKDEERRIKFAARNAFGFGEEGYIFLVYGDNERIKKWREELPEHTVWYNETFGWFIPATREYDGLEFPADIHFAKLEWETVKDKNDEEQLQMMDKEEVRKIVEQMIYEPSKSEFQGEVNTWLEKEVKIVKNISLSSNYGDSHMHIMEDDDENVYVWTTASKNLEEGKTYTIKMKVKEHKEYKGTKQTIVYYCKVK